MPEGTEKQPLNKSKKSHITAFRYCGNIHYYVSICSTVFKNNICMWLVYVTYCSILQSSSLETFFLFESAQVLQLVNESDG